MEGEDKIVESMRRFANDAKCVEYLKTFKEVAVLGMFWVGCLWVNYDEIPSLSGVVKCPMTWVYWTSPKIVAI